ncbi:hypothetical protein TcasGA2_TC030988 [Tribolium castaneum]|uniref:Uncharacterized protein n=1 Tax=Tribolium castaneum TaxID=7070 RepID=A0A139WME5_TRICA|nr:hypothetical protein TcasGA2_TC030988 [Tribolium castaneum]
MEDSTSSLTLYFLQDVVNFSPLILRTTTTSWTIV